MPEVQNGSFHLASHTVIDGDENDNMAGQEIISQFGKYVRDKFGGKVRKLTFPD